MSLRGPLVTLEVGAGAHCARTDTVGRARPRGGPVWSTLAALGKRKETLETRVVSDGVEGVSGERVRQLTAEQIGSAPQVWEETVDDELPVKQMIEVRKGLVEQFFEMLEPQMVVRLVDVPKIVVGLAASSGSDGSSGPGRRDTIADTAVEVLVGGAWPPRISLYSTATESEVEGSSGEAGSSWPGADDMPCHVGATVAKVVGEARPPGIAEHSVATTLVPRERVQQRTDMAVSFGGAGPWWPRAMGRPADFARPPGIAKKSATLLW